MIEQSVTKACRTCIAKGLPDIVEPCNSCVNRSNWRSGVKQYCGAEAIKRAWK